MSLNNMWKHFLKILNSIFNTNITKEPKTLHDDWKNIQNDWRFLVDDADILESLYQEIENDNNSK